MTILKYEIKKMLCTWTSRIALSFLIILAAVLCISYVHSASWTMEDGSSINGFKAIKNMKAAKSEWNGTISENVIAKVITENKTIADNPAYRNEAGDLTNAGYSKTQGFYDIRSMINDFYRDDLLNYNYYTADHLSPDASTGFYEKRIALFQDWMNRDEVKQRLSDGESSYISNSVMNLKTPFNYSYSDGWIKTKEMNVALIFGVAIIICIILATDFSVECQTKSDSIYLTTRYGKTKGNRMKLAGGFLLATVIYWGIMLLSDFILLLCYGMDGASNPIQIECFKCVLNISQIQAWGITLLLGYVGCLLMASIAMFLSARFKASFVSIILSFLILMVPATLGQSVTNLTLQEILSFFPHSSIMGYDILKSYTFYQIGGAVLTKAHVLPVIHSLFAVLLIPFSYKSFQKYKL